MIKFNHTSDSAFDCKDDLKFFYYHPGNVFIDAGFIEFPARPLRLYQGSYISTSQRRNNPLYHEFVKVYL